MKPKNNRHATTGGSRVSQFLYFPVLARSGWPKLNRVEFRNYTLFSKYQKDNWGKSDSDLRVRARRPKPKKLSSVASYSLFLRTLLQENRQLLTDHPELNDDRVITRLAKAELKRHQIEAKAAKARRRAFRRVVLSQFDRVYPEGEYDFESKLTTRESLRQFLSDYLLAAPYIRIEEYEESKLASYIVDALSWKMREPIRLMDILIEEQEVHAVHWASRLCLLWLRSLNEIAEINPELFAPISTHLPAWPVFKSRHKQFNPPESQFLEKLQVGENYPFIVDRFAKWSANDPVARWAVHLYHEIEIMMDGRLVMDDSPQWLKKLEKIPPFGKDTWTDWWQVADGLLKDEYVDVLKISELADSVRSPSDRKSKGKFRKRIHQKLRDKFKSMAGMNKL